MMFTEVTGACWWGNKTCDNPVTSVTKVNKIVCCFWQYFISHRLLTMDFFMKWLYSNPITRTTKWDIFAPWGISGPCILYDLVFFRTILCSLQLCSEFRVISRTLEEDLISSRHSCSAYLAWSTLPSFHLPHKFDNPACADSLKFQCRDSTLRPVFSPFNLSGRILHQSQHRYVGRVHNQGMFGYMYSSLRNRNIHQ